MKIHNPVCKPVPNKKRTIQEGIKEIKENCGPNFLGAPNWEPQLKDQLTLRDNNVNKRPPDRKGL